MNMIVPNKLTFTALSLVATGALLLLLHVMGGLKVGQEASLLYAECSKMGESNATLFGGVGSFTRNPAEVTAPSAQLGVVAVTGLSVFISVWLMLRTFFEQSYSALRLPKPRQKSASSENHRKAIANFAHEIRTPLTILAMEIEAVKYGLKSFDVNQAESMEHEVDRLSGFVDDLQQLNANEEDSFSYVMETIELTSLVAGVVERFSGLSKEKKLRISVSTKSPLNVRGDPRRIEQLVSNLVANSLNYTAAPGHVCIEIKNLDGHACVQVEDTMPTVSEAECDRLFQSGYRSEHKGLGATPGAGLGLAICKNIIVAHGGDIYASPGNLGGLNVVARFPLG